MTEPRYDHDCNACSFLGHYEEYDLYFHRDPIEAFIFAKLEEGNNRTILVPISDIELLINALSLAKEKGLYKEGESND